MKNLLVMLMLLASPTLASAQVTIPFVFTSNTVISSTQVNSDFSELGTKSLNRTGGTMSGSLTAQTIAATADATYDIGAVGVRFRNAFLSGSLTSASQTLNLAGVTVGDITYLGAAAAVTRLASVATGQFLQSGGAGSAPAWGKIPAFTTTYFTSLAFDAANLTGTVAAARLGSGSPSATTYLRGDSTWASLPQPVTLAKAANYNPAVVNDFVLATGTFTVTLPSAVGNQDKVIDVKNVSTGVITVASLGGTIDGSATVSLPMQYQSLTFISDGTNWWIK